MTLTKPETKIHPAELELADLLSNSLSGAKKAAIEDHIACCDECLDTVVAAYEAVKSQNKDIRKKGKVTIMKKINIYLILAIASFILSFTTPQYFIQFLVATLLLGIKWIVDAKSTKMLIMIYEAWKKGGEKEASRILGSIDSESKSRF